MSRYTAILDGCTIVNMELALGSYNYYGYMRNAGITEWVIMREKTDNTEYKYAIGSANNTYATAWAAKASQNYRTPDQLPATYIK